MELRTVETNEHISLLAGPEVKALTKNVTIVAAADAIEAGTLMSTATSPATVTAKAGAADAVLANAVAKGDTVATVYITGRFNRAALKAADGDTVDAHEEELRKLGIFLTTVL